MRTDNALIIGAKTPTDANGTVNRVCPGGYVDVIREGECRGDKAADNRDQPERAVVRQRGNRNRA